MASRTGRAALAALVLVLPGCKDDSAVPLGPASEGVIEPRLLGAWTCVGSDEDAEPGSLAFSRFDETQYLVQVQAEGEDPSHLRAYSSTMADATFLNLQELRESGGDAERGWRFLEYSFGEDGVLRLRMLAPDVLEDGDDTMEAARRAVEAALADPEALIDGLRCTRRPAR